MKFFFLVKVQLVDYLYRPGKESQSSSLEEQKIPLNTEILLTT